MNNHNHFLVFDLTMIICMLYNNHYMIIAMINHNHLQFFMKDNEHPLKWKLFQANSMCDLRKRRICI